MRAGRGHFTRRPESRKGAAPGRIDAHTAHMVVRRRGDRDGLTTGIDPGGLAAGMDSGKTFGKRRADRRPRVEERSAPGSELFKYAARDDVARRQFGSSVT